MRIPEPLYGAEDLVRHGAAAMTADCLAAGVWPGDAEGADTARLDGLVLMSPPAEAASNEPSFHCYLPAVIVTDRIVTNDLSPLVEQDTFDQWLAADWSLIGLLAPVNVAWFRQPARFRPFLKRVVNRWSALSELDSRYSQGGGFGQDLWSIPTNLKYVLANMGLTEQELRRPLPAGGLAPLSALVEGWDGVPAVERWN